MRGRAVISRLLLCAAIVGVDCADAARASAAPPVEQQVNPDPVIAALQACGGNEFDKFLRLYAQSKAVRERFTSDQVNVAAGDAPARFMSKAEYLDRFPLAAHGWNYVTPNSLLPGKEPDYLLVQTRSVAMTVRRVDWVDARFDSEPPDGRWIGVPVEIRGTPGKLTFVTTDDGCWHLTDDVQAPKDTPFEQGIPRLHCTVRSDDYRRELARVERLIPDHPEDMNVGRDLAVCANLLNMIERTIRSNPRLIELRLETDKRLATLARRQRSSERAALAQDERRFRRSLMLDQYVLADGTTGDWDMPGDLEQRLLGRLETLNRIESLRQDYEGKWSNALGILDITRDGKAYRIDANPVDIDFLAWTCEFEGTMHRTKDGLELDDVEGETVLARLRDGVLVIEHRPTPGGFIGTCGAGGSISGTYFPIKPVPEPPSELKGEYPPPDEFKDGAARP